MKNYVEIIDKIDNTYEKYLMNLNNNDSINIDKIFKNSFMNKEFSDFIFNLVEEFYKNSVLNNLKPKDGEFNIFSSIILQNKTEYRLIIFTSGTKSIPNKFNKDLKEFKIRDCHAEILALRCLKHFLIKCLSFNILLKFLSNHFSNNFWGFDKEFYINNNLQIYLSFEEFESFFIHKEFFDIFEFPLNFKIFLKENILFHLYISETPCGDCSIYPIFDNDDIQDNLNNKKNSNFTGAKTIEELLIALEKDDLNKTNNLNNTIIQSEKKNNKINNKFFIKHNNDHGKFRSKSMRSDVKKENITLSLSCSDKLMLKNLFGIQGKILYKILNPIYISSMIISVKSIKDQEHNKDIEDSIRRGLSIIRRDINLDLNFKKFGFFISEPKIILTEKEIFNFNHTFFTKKKIINEVTNDGFMNNDIELSMSNDKYIQPFSIYWYYSKCDFQKIDPSSGFKQGTVVKKDKFNLEKSKLDICDIDFFLKLLKLLNLYSNCNINIKKDENNFQDKNLTILINLKINKMIFNINSLINDFNNSIIQEKFLNEILLLNNYMKNLKENSIYNRFKTDIFVKNGLKNFIDYKNI